jgi:PAS domain S-box-containing protein
VPEPLDLAVLFAGAGPHAGEVTNALGGVAREVQAVATWEALEVEAARGIHGAALVEEAVGGRERLLGWLPSDPCRAPVLVLLDGPDEEAELAYLRAGAADVLVGAPSAEELRRALARARARRALQDARAWEEERYRLMVEHIFDVVFVLDGFGRYVYASPSIEEKLGYRPEELIGQSAFEALHPEDLDHVMGVFMEAVVQPGTTREMVYRIVHRDGSARHMEGVGRAIVGPDGQPYGVINARDVTERRAAEDALRASEARFRALLEALPDALARVSADGLILDFHVPPTFEVDVRPEDVRGRRVADVLPPAFAGVYEAVLAQLRETGEPFTYRYETTAGGKPRHRELRVVGNEAGEVIAVIRDVTAEVAAADALRQQEALVRQVVTSVPVIAFAFAPDGTITLAEGRGLTQIGSSSEDLVGRSVFEAYAKYPGILRAARAALDGEAINLVAEVRGHAFDAYLAPVRDLVGRVTRVIGVAADVTELKAQQDALARQAEALAEQTAELERSRADLRALAAHLQEVREEERARISREVHDVLGQQLTAIRLGVGALARRLAADPEGEARADDTRALIDETIQRVRDIAAELRPGILDDLGLASALEWYAERFGARAGLPCRLAVAGTDEAVPPEAATAVFRIFQETLTNAARHARASAVDARLEVTPGRILLRVRDDGVGIAPERLEAARTLGLLGMRERARALGGTVEIEGAPGDGTTVTVRIPLPAPASGGHAPSSPAGDSLPRTRSGGARGTLTA